MQHFYLFIEMFVVQGVQSIQEFEYLTQHFIDQCILFNAHLTVIEVPNRNLTLCVDTKTEFHGFRPTSHEICNACQNVLGLEVETGVTVGNLTR